MRTIAMLLLCIFAFTTLSASSAKYAKIGNFNIDSLCKHSSFLLDDGNVYKPISHSYKQKSRDWQVGDKILVLKSEHYNQFVLVNTKSGAKIKAEVIDESSCY